ncbi:MAG: hypothetical protein KGH71_01745 [Candidatus Micrarchaeota archaeon]|nr:hypothetical protein [Candidatus Micrarchaeota archaeon]
MKTLQQTPQEKASEIVEHFLDKIHYKTNDFSLERRKDGKTATFFRNQFFADFDALAIMPVNLANKEGRRGFKKDILKAVKFQLRNRTPEEKEIIFKTDILETKEFLYVLCHVKRPE